MTLLLHSSPNASWHTDYRDTAFIYFGGLPYDLSEGDVITIFSQYGEPVFLKLARDKETGKSKGFGWLKYEDQRSTDLAVDNLGGATIGGRLISVDHAHYKARDDEDDEEFKVGWEDIQRREGGQGGGQASDTDMDDATPATSDGEDTPGSERRKKQRHSHRPLLREERELQRLIDEHDDEDPMKMFLIEKKKKEVDEAQRLRGRDGNDNDNSDRRRRHRHHERHRSHRSHPPHRDDGGDYAARDKPRRRDGSGERHHRDELDRRERDSRSHRDSDRDRDRKRHQDAEKDTDRKDEHSPGYDKELSRRWDRDRRHGRDDDHRR